MDLISGALLVGSMYTAFEVIDRLDIGEVVASKFRRKDDYCLTLGYRRICGMRVPIIANMKITPHLLVCGLSGQGKSKCIEYTIKNKNAILLNAFEEDFRSVKCRRVFGNENILRYLTKLLESPYKRETPFYVVID